MDNNEPPFESKLANINSLLTQIGKRLVNFTVVNYQCKYIGTVKDIYYDNYNQANLLISPREIDDDLSSLRCLNSQQIENINLNRKQIIVAISVAEIQNLPVYKSVPKNWQQTSATEEKSTFIGTERSNAALTKSSQRTVKQEEIIPLLEERLKVNRHRRKIGEVVVRKEIETKMVQVEVPVRQEKLIVEQVGAESKKLAEINLGEPKITGIANTVAEAENSHYLVKSKLVSLSTASKILQELAEVGENNQQVRLEIVARSPKQQVVYQIICDRHV